MKIKNINLPEHLISEVDNESKKQNVRGVRI